jgi:hypothetical protein
MSPQDEAQGSGIPGVVGLVLCALFPAALLLYFSVPNLRTVTTLEPPRVPIEVVIAAGLAGLLGTFISLIAAITGTGRRFGRAGLWTYSLTWFLLWVGMRFL